MSFDKLDPRTLWRVVRGLTRELWVRVVLLGMLALATLGLTQLLQPLVPQELAQSLDGAAADRLLDIIANAMLAVTTFSLTVMVTVYRASSQQWTPRVHRLIMQDRTTQNVLAVFIGAYVYALVAIVMRETGVYTDEGAFVLFVMTAIVIAVIVIYLVRWVLHLQSFGSLMAVARQIEEATSKQFTERLSKPCLGANPLTGDVPDGARPIRAQKSGYVQYIFPEALNDLAAEHDVDLYLTRGIGTFVFLNEPVCQVVRRGGGGPDDTDADTFADEVRRNIVMGDLRTYSQDPRFGLVVLGEVASKALSPGVNDPGTAIDVIGRVGRVLSLYRDEVAQGRDEAFTHLYVAPLDPDDLIIDGFAALARDGAEVVEVQVRLQSVLSGLMRHPEESLARAARRAAETHLARALQAISFAPDRDRVSAAAESEVCDAVLRS